jgi:hypothetical protein
MLIGIVSQQEPLIRSYPSTSPFMQPEHMDLETLVKERREAVNASLKQLSVEEIKTLGETLFSDPTHPWAEPFQHFLQENSGCIFYHAKTDEQIEVVYCRSKEKGIWFRQGVGVGILQPKALDILREIVDSK